MKIRQKITGTADGRGYVLMAALAFFHFVFLGTEYLFDDMMALVTEPTQVVTAQGYVLGASVLGFLLYPAVVSGMERKRERAVPTRCCFLQQPLPAVKKCPTVPR